MQFGIEPESGTALIVVRHAFFKLFCFKPLTSLIQKLTIKHPIFRSTRGRSLVTQRMKNLEGSCRGTQHLALIQDLPSFMDDRRNRFVTGERQGITDLDTQRLKLDLGAACLDFLQGLLLVLIHGRGPRGDFDEFTNAYGKNHTFWLNLKELTLWIYSVFRKKLVKDLFQLHAVLHLCCEITLKRKRYTCRRTQRSYSGAYVISGEPYLDKARHCFIC